MKWRITKKPIPDYLDWHTWFAWKPVRIGDYKYWLCYVSRKAKWNTVYNTDLNVEIKDKDAVNRIIHHCGCRDWEYKEVVWYC